MQVKTTRGGLACNVPFAAPPCLLSPPRTSCLKVSAVEGLQFQTGMSQEAVVGASIAILVVLFGMQGFGTHRVSGLFRRVLLEPVGGSAAAGRLRRGDARRRRQQGPA